MSSRFKINGRTAQAHMENHDVRQSNKNAEREKTGAPNGTNQPKWNGKRVHFTRSFFLRLFLFHRFHKKVNAFFFNRNFASPFCTFYSIVVERIVEAPERYKSLNANRAMLYCQSTASNKRTFSSECHEINSTDRIQTKPHTC